MASTDRIEGLKAWAYRTRMQVSIPEAEAGLLGYDAARQGRRVSDDAAAPLGEGDDAPPGPPCRYDSPQSSPVTRIERTLGLTPVGRIWGRPLPPYGIHRERGPTTMERLAHG